MAQAVFESELRKMTDVSQYVAYFEVQQRVLEDDSRDTSKIEIRNHLYNVITLSNS